MAQRVVFATLGSILLLTGPTPAASEPVAWDQASVSEHARNLATKADAIHRDIRSRQLGDQNRRDFYRLRETVRRIRSETARLASLLEDGGGHDETLPVFEQLGSQVRNAREIAKRMFMTTGLQDRFAAARAVLDDLAPYYDAAPLPPPIRRG